MGTPTLYHALHSTCSQKARYALAYKRVEYHSRIVDLDNHEHLSDEYLAINPNGVVPTMHHDGWNIVDSSVICEYVDEVFEGASLSPAAAPQRATMRSWMRYLEEVPTVAIRVPSINALLAGRHGRAIRSMKQKNASPLRGHFYARLGPVGFPAELIRESTEQLANCLKRVEHALHDTGAYLAGSQLTIADIVLLPTVVRMEDLGLSHMWREHPHLAHWYAAMQREPAFEQTYVPGARLIRS